jgi:hypothetical protein
MVETSDPDVWVEYWAKCAFMSDEARTRSMWDWGLLSEAERQGYRDQIVKELLVRLGFPCEPT